MKKPLFLLLLLTSMLAQSQKDLRNLSYGDQPQHTLDLFLPASFDKNTPVILMLHGGAWMMGGKEYTDKTSRDLRDRGFLVANVDYRYVSEKVNGQDLLSDIAASVKKMQTLSKQYGFKPSDYHLAGISAGAHLALLYGYTAKGVKSISALCAPSRLNDDEELAVLKKHNLERNVELLAGSKFIEGKAPDAKFDKISPHTRISNVPTLLIHGDADPLVPYSQSVKLHNDLEAKKIPSKLITMQGKGHDAGMNDRDTERLALDEISDWVKKYE